jgi:hypothetical protein
MAILPKEIQRLFRKVRDLFIAAIFPNSGIFKAKFFRFIVGGIESGKFDFSKLVSGDDLNDFYREFRKLRDEYVEENLGDILGMIEEKIPAEKLKELPKFFLDFFAAKERFLNDITNINKFIKLPADIRVEMFESSKSLRIRLLDRYLPIALKGMNINDDKVLEFVKNKKKKREFFFNKLFPKVINDAKSIALRVDDKLIWSRADKLFEAVASGKVSLS